VDDEGMKLFLPRENKSHLIFPKGDNVRNCESADKRNKPQIIMSRTSEVLESY
jgi:hypothetical protein